MLIANSTEEPFNLGDLTKTIFCLKTGQAVKRSSGQSALTCFNSSFQSRSVVTKNAETDAYYQKMVLTYNITFFIGMAVFLVLGFLINVTLLDEDEDLIFVRILIIFLNIIWSILVVCFYWYMSVKLQNLEERRAAEIKEEKKILTGTPKKSSIKTGYGTIGKMERV